MRIFLLKIGEPLPTDDGSPRFLRMGLLAEMLVKQGHEVVWWTSTFNHAEKNLRAKKDKTLRVSDDYTIKLIHSIIALHYNFYDLSGRNCICVGEL